MSGMSLVAMFVPRNSQKTEQLEDHFMMIKDKRIDTSSTLQEIAVQLGQLTSILSEDKLAEENGRKFNDIEDELCDILLNLIYLTNSLKIDISSIMENSDYVKFSSTNLNSLMQLFGQINEAYLEESGHRFSKPRYGFKTRLDFIADRIVKMYLIIFNYGLEHDIDLEKRFNEMCQEATKFVLAKTSTQPTKKYKGRKLALKNQVTHGICGLF